MRSRNGEFGIFQRHVSPEKSIFYYWCYDDTGRRIYRSTGKDKYDDAVKKCRELMKTNSLYIPKDMAFNIVFKDYFIYDICPYINQLKLRNRNYSRTWAERQRSLLVKYMFKRFADMQISDIGCNEIQDWIDQLVRDGMCYKTANHLITTMRTMFGNAHMKGLVFDNPMRFIKPFNIESKEKGVFSKQELSELFNLENKNTIWSSDMHYYLNKLACLTGMRLGEIQALSKDSLKPNYIEVKNSWNPLDKVKDTKTGNIRRIPLDPQFVQNLLNINTNNTSFVFPNDNGTPMDHKTIYRYFYDALDSIGIPLEIRRMRNITFHSYRHTFNTRLLEAGVHPEIVRLYTGHVTKNMTYHYAHVLPERLPELF
jgi:integrase